MKKRRKSSPTDPFADLVKKLSGELVDPQPLLDSEFERARRELLASFEADMSFWDRTRFRYELWKLRNRYRKLSREAIG